MGSILSSPCRVADWNSKGDKGIMTPLISNATDGGTGYKTQSPASNMCYTCTD